MKNGFADYFPDERDMPRLIGWRPLAFDEIIRADDIWYDEILRIPLQPIKTLGMFAIQGFRHQCDNLQGNINNPIEEIGWVYRKRLGSEPNPAHFSESLPLP